MTATGMLGLVAMTAARRTREIGIRLALGATRPAVVRQIVREQLGAVAIGLRWVALQARQPFDRLLRSCTRPRCTIQSPGRRPSSC